MLAAQYNKDTGEQLTIVDNVSLSIEFATRNSQHERILSVY
jgi:hypothetical protein